MTVFDRMITKAKRSADPRPSGPGGVVAPTFPTSNPSEGACRTAELYVMASHLSASLRDWAADIEADEKQQPQLLPGEINKPRGDVKVPKSNGNGKGRLKPSREKAYRLFQWAMEQKPELKTDRQVYDWRTDRPEIPEDLPNFDSWSKYLREARSHHDDHKHTPRIEKTASGKSVVRREQI